VQTISSANPHHSASLQITAGSEYIGPGSLFSQGFGHRPRRPVHLPSFIRPIGANIGEAELEFLINKNVFYVPDEAVRLDILHAYFQAVHPLMPLFDKADFLDICTSGPQGRSDQKSQVSLLLLQATMFAGSAVRISRIHMSEIVTITVSAVCGYIILESSWLRDS
jgi:hypothetical protein